MMMLEAIREVRNVWLLLFSTMSVSFTDVWLSDG